MAGRGKASNLPPLSRDGLVRARLRAVLDAETSLLAYARITMPDRADPADPRKSEYQAARHHLVLIDALERVERGEIMKLIVTMPPRHGKTETADKRFVPWFKGKNPGKSIIAGTYGQEFAEDLGRAVRDILQDPAHKQVFPHCRLKDASTKPDRMETTDGGALFFVGRGGTVTGRGADLIVIDDPLKNDEEANSPAIREKAWTWFTRTIGSRGMTENMRMVLITTRWHDDDIVGRITDPANPHYSEAEAKRWHILDLPALASDDGDDPLGRKPGEALWPERFGEKWLRDRQELDPRGFAALYQGRPSPEDGAFFRADYLNEYTTLRALPPDLRYYAVSDHAVGLKQHNDKSVLLPFGVDKEDFVWILPDVVWGKLDAAAAVEAMLRIIKARMPIYWWAERGHISSSIGPFLRKRMQEEHTFTSLVEVTPAVDKQQRAQAIAGRMSTGRVKFPSFAPWWPQAREQILKFPYAANDDFVDALSLIGIGLMTQVGAKVAQPRRTATKVGTIGWVKEMSDKRRLQESLQRQSGGW